MPGCSALTIFASGGLNEDEVAKLMASGAPIDGFGVGADMGVSRDAPSLDFAYKLVEYAGQPRMKLSAGKTRCRGASRSSGSSGTTSPLAMCSDGVTSKCPAVPCCST